MKGENRMSNLVSVGGEVKTKVSAPEKNPKTAAVLIVVGGVIGVLSVAFSGFENLLGLAAVFAAISFVLAGVYQFRGVRECTCPYCKEKGYLRPNDEKYKCRVCKNTSFIETKSEE